MQQLVSLPQSKCAMLQHLQHLLTLLLLQGQGSHSTHCLVKHLNLTEQKIWDGGHLLSRWINFAVALSRLAVFAVDKLHIYFNIKSRWSLLDPILSYFLLVDYHQEAGDNVAEWSVQQAHNPVDPVLSPAPVTCLICSWSSWVQILSHACKYPTVCLLPVGVFNPVKMFYLDNSLTSPYRHLYNTDTSLLQAVRLVPEVPKIIHSLPL